jgi:sugar phosphate isomerase/epimerase
MKRRKFIRTSATLPLAGMAVSSCTTTGRGNSTCYTGSVSLSLNAYSFNSLLQEGEMSLEQLFAFARETGFRGVDLTAYYIPGYPEVPADSVLFDIRKLAFRYGLAISGTGVRNDFTLADPEERKKEKQLVMDWVVAASKLGAPHLRIFDGRTEPEGYTREEITAWIALEMAECAAFGRENGVVISYQNHNDFLKTSGEIGSLIETVDSGWFGLMLDVGSLPEEEVSGEIEKLIPYAVSWQVKEKVLNGGEESPTDFGRLVPLIIRSGYRGWLPLETLGEGDPYEKVLALYRTVSHELSLATLTKTGA